jgi:hypothetical protein
LFLDAADILGMHQNIGCLFDPHTPLAGHGPNKVFFQPSVFWGWSLAIQKDQAPLDAPCATLSNVPSAGA